MITEASETQPLAWACRPVWRLTYTNTGQINIKTSLKHTGLLSVGVVDLLMFFISPRLAAENLSWDAGAVLGLNRDHFGPKGRLEVLSEQLIQQASCGELQAVSEILQTGLVHPDVADSRGNTALIAAAVTAVSRILLITKTCFCFCSCCSLVQMPDFRYQVTCSVFPTAVKRFVSPSGKLPPRCAPPVVRCRCRH